ncbi:MAG: radical SAM protein, partial [Thermoproteota archaeon]
MRVLLVDPPKPRWWLLRDTVMPNLGLAYLAAYLREAGVEVSILDCDALGLRWKDLEERLSRAELVGVGGPTCHSHLSLRVLKMAKEESPDVVTVAGGPHFTALADSTLRE